MQNLSDFQVGSVSWRQTLRSNERRTLLVMILFLLLYTAVGVILDLSFFSNLYPNASLSVLIKALATFQLKPTLTLVFLGVGALSILITLAFHNKLMLLGTDYREITPDTAKTVEEQQLYNVVEEMKIAAGLNYMPKVFLIEADYMNAFASGYSEKSAMLSITRGLMQKLTREELQAVMAHELSHVRHHDIKLTLMASVLANLMLMVIDTLFYSAIYGGRSRRRDEGRGSNNLFLIIFVLRAVLPLLTFFLMMYLSRTREYMADAGAVQLMRDNVPMARALMKIHADHQTNADEYKRAYEATAHEQVRHAAYIYDPSAAGIRSTASLMGLFSTHPKMAERLEALGFKQK